MESVVILICIASYHDLGSNIDLVLKFDYSIPDMLQVVQIGSFRLQLTNSSIPGNTRRGPSVAGRNSNGFCSKKDGSGSFQFDCLQFPKRRFTRFSLSRTYCIYNHTRRGARKTSVWKTVL